MYHEYIVLEFDSICIMNIFSNCELEIGHILVKHCSEE